MADDTSANFSFLQGQEDLLLRLCVQAERSFSFDPATTVIKMGQLAEAIAQHAAAACGAYTGPELSALDVLRLLERKNMLGPEIRPVFHSVRIARNRAAHDYQATHADALNSLRMGRQVAAWFVRTFGGQANLKLGAFEKPRDPTEKLRAHQEEVARLRAELAESQEGQAKQAELADAERKERDENERARKALEEERDLALQLAAETEEQALERENRLKAEYEKMLGALQKQAEMFPEADLRAQAQKAQQASEKTELSEAETRVIIDDQLRAAGWTVDSHVLRYAAGVRPQKGVNMAIAEWPTSSGPADYVLFVGLCPVAIVEAKKKTKNIPGALTQAKRYSRDYVVQGPETLPGPALTFEANFPGWPTETGGSTHYRVPFLYATNGRAYHRQVETQSGIWFVDVRKPTNHPRALMGWPSPDGLIAQLHQDVDDAHKKLQEEPTEYLGLRPYQLTAIEKVEGALEQGQREILLAMATGTGKTRTVIGLIYRLLKANRFRRVLFLVDRTALGIQAQNAFKDMRLEQNRTFAEIFEVKELTDLLPDASTRVHVATVQAMVKRCLFPAEDAEGHEDIIPIDQYDAIVVDESHRGYNLDMEMSEGEMEVRSLADYVSIYRRVLDYFDAVRIGLTATPALHTREIFGDAVYAYSYPTAVIDGWLIDHEPPIRLMTKLAEQGIHFDKGSEVPLLKPGEGVQLALLPDELDFEVADFNKKVIAPNFTKVVCETLADHLDPEGEDKTLVFCCTDEHADRVVLALKAAFKEKWGEIDDNAVQKITGATDKTMEVIRRYRNEKLPNIAVTVDLLTTGVDIPRICNLVFLRRVRSRILYEQMMGRATRRCEEIGKEVFRIYDAVGIYDVLEDVTEMKPVVTTVNIGFGTLVDELRSDAAHNAPGREPGTTHAHDVKNQMVARLRRHRNRAKGLATLPAAYVEAEDAVKHTTGKDLEELADALVAMGPEEARAYFEKHPALSGLLLDVFVSLRGLGRQTLLADHEDELVEVSHGYGDANKPEDYLEAFKKFVEERKNEIAAMKVVLTRPRELTRAQLKELRVALHESGYTEPNIRAAWRDMTNQDIAASIIGWIRQQALGSTLMSYEERVDRALKKVMAMEKWTKPQQKWLERIAAQLRKEVIVDEEAFAHGAFESKGGYQGIDKQLGGKLDVVLDAFGDGIWEDAA